MALDMLILGYVRERLEGKVPLRLYNTLTKRKETFEMPPQAKEVRMYNCGPTVYDRQHIGNLSMFVFTDVLRRALEYDGFSVKQVINFTDVGHLAGDNQGDADQGEDKMTKGLLREDLSLTLENMKTLGRKYAEKFVADLRLLNVDTDRVIFPYASDHIAGDIAMVKTLEEKGYAYRTSSGVYFDTSRFPTYGALGDVDLAGLKEGARVMANPEKRNPIDFLLWKFDSRMGWDSPWGKGFPGWHIECSVMIHSCLGKQIDIHTGGVEHIRVHHNNEIAQSEAALGRRPLSRFWLHRAHVRLDGGKLSKSEGRVVYLSDVVSRGLHPLALRYLFLSAHYRTPSNFSWQALEAAHVALFRLAGHLRGARASAPRVPKKYRRHFLRRINDDLDTPRALAVLWEAAKDPRLAPEELRALLLDADKILGLGLLSLSDSRAVVQKEDLPADLRALFEEREQARAKHDFGDADRIRTVFRESGYTLVDTAEGTSIEKLS